MSTILITEPEFTALRDAIRDRFGIFYDDTKQFLLQSRLQTRLLKRSCRNFEGYYKFLTSSLQREEEWDELASVLCNNETYFFRERAQLDEILSARGRDPMVRGNALLQRAVLLRETGEPRAALVDLAAAGPALHMLGSVADEFAANLELARTLRTLGRPRAALAAVATALRQSDALRLQTINPELRSQLQAPLRAAYDLKIELLRARYEAAAAAGHEVEAQAVATEAFAAADASRAHSLADIAAQEYTPEVRRALATDLRRREQLHRAQCLVPPGDELLGYGDGPRAARSAQRHPVCRLQQRAIFSLRQVSAPHAGDSQEDARILPEARTGGRAISRGRSQS